MKTINLRCDHCAAPLEIMPDANYATCAFCHSQLEIQSTGTSFSTRVLDQLVTNTDQIRDEVRAVRNRLEIRELDFRWERQRHSFADFDETGVASYSTPNVVLVKGVVVTICYLLFTFYTQAWFLFSFVSVLIALKFGFDFTKAIDFKEAQEGYLKRRRSLEAKLTDEA